MATTSIVVGVDESTGAADALRWAVAETEVHGAELTAVLAWGLLDQHQAIVGERFDPSYASSDAVDALRGYVAAAVGPERASTVHAVAVCDLPARALLDASASANLLVVGARGLGGFQGLLLGSVSQQCLQHASVPVAVVRGHRHADGRAPVVVGVDGSDHAQHALRWALDEARARRVPLEVVTAWQLPHTGGLPSAAAVDPIIYERAAEHVLADALAAEDVDGVEIEQRVTAGQPAAALLAAASDAALLVVGSRGRGALARAVLGSVATQVTHHADCPVVVVPARADRNP